MRHTFLAIGVVLGGCGDNSNQGPAGPSGITGDPGAMGDKGVMGEMGNPGKDGTNGASCPVGGGLETQAEGVPSSAPLSAVVAFTFCDAAGTGKTNIADYVKELVDRYAKGTIDPTMEFPLASGTTDSVRSLAGLVPDIVVKWFDPLTWDNMTTGTTTPRFGANNDHLEFFGDGWTGTPFWTGSDNAGYMWVNHEYMSNETDRPFATVAAKRQHLTLARFLNYWGVITTPATSNAWPAGDLAIYVDEYKKQVGGTYMRIIKDPASADWQVDKSTLPVRYDATDSTLIKVTGQTVTTDTDDNGVALPAGVVTGMHGNCSGAMTPWGTVFTGEENISFSYGDLEAWDSGNRLTAGRGFDPGANIAPTLTPSASGSFTSGTASHPRDAYGYLVEIDPGKPADEFYNKTMPGDGHRKVGYMGRAAWENATFALGTDFKLLPNQPIVIYSGNDRRSGHIYKFVTAGNYTAGMTKAQQRALLDTGKLYVAHFAGLDNANGRTLLGGAIPTEQAPGTGQWIELSTTSTAIAPNAAGLGVPTMTVGAALQDVSYNNMGGFPTDTDVRRALFTASLKVGAMELNRPEDLEYNPFGAPGLATPKPRIYVAFTNHNRAAGCVALTQAGVYNAAATPINRGDTVGGVFAMEETTSATPATSTSFKYWQAWGGSITPGLFAAGDPDNILIDKNGGVWFGTDGYWGTSAKKSADAFYYLDLDPAHKTTSTNSFGLAFRVAAMPSDAEVTGPAFTPGMKTMFLSVQHPGEDNFSAWPPR